MTNAGATDSALTGSASLLAVRNLHTSTTLPGRAPELRGLDLTIGVGEVHAIIGDSSTSAIGPTLLGAPDRRVASGRIHFLGDDVTDWPVDERAKAGMFLAFRRPAAMPGVSLAELLQRAESSRLPAHTPAPTPGRRSASELRTVTDDWVRRVGLTPGTIDDRLAASADTTSRLLSEIVQLAVLAPAFAVIEHADASPQVAHAISELRAEHPRLGLLLVSPASQFLTHVTPHRVHTLADGRITASGGPELAHQLERDDHESFQKVGV